MQQLTRDNFSAFIASGETVMVDFWATWCGPCMRQGQVLEAIAQADATIGARIGKVNVDDERELAVNFEVMSIPTLIFFKDGKEIDRFIGLRSAEEITGALKG